MFLYYTQGGFLIVRPEDDLRFIVDAILGTGYNEEFCVSVDFSADFIARLMEAGFLVMSSRLEEPEDTPVPAETVETFILLPKLHLSRSVLFFDNLHIKKSIKRYLDRYELRFDTDFDHILDRCIAVHGDHWLTPPLVSAIRTIRQHRLHGVYPASFALYRNGKLLAGDFGIIAGRVYTSYSGYHDESNSGTAQLILISRYLRENGFAFFDLGMPIEYKTSLGATDISPEEFISLFRAAQTVK
jgi:Leu/Phe-tRNA-protein transferase